MIRKMLALSVLLLAAGVIWAPAALAQSRGRRITFEEIEVKGKVQKPEITIFISRQNLNPEYNLDLRQSFVPKILESIDKKPF